jgi:uncharacterized protein (TIGR02444 family)
LVTAMGKMTSKDAADEFWQFSLEVYAKPQVAELCLALQDEHGFDVNVLLLCLWLAQGEGRTISQFEIGDLLGGVAALNENMVWPVRGARRWAKSWLQQAPDLQAEAARDKLYTSLKATELQIERQIQIELVRRLAYDRQQQGQPLDLSAQSAARLSMEAYRAAIAAQEGTAALLTRLALNALA